MTFSATANHDGDGSDLDLGRLAFCPRDADGATALASGVAGLTVIDGERCSWSGTPTSGSRPNTSTPRGITHAGHARHRRRWRASLRLDQRAHGDAGSAGAWQIVRRRHRRSDHRDRRGVVVSALSYQPDSSRPTRSPSSDAAAAASEHSLKEFGPGGVTSQTRIELLGFAVPSAPLLEELVSQCHLTRADSMIQGDVDDEERRSAAPRPRAWRNLLEFLDTNAEGQQAKLRGVCPTTADDRSHARIMNNDTQPDMIAFC